MRALLGVVVVAACGGPPAAKLEDCAHAAHHVEGLVKASVREVVTARCSQDAWSEDEVACVIGANAADELAACRRDLGDSVAALAVANAATHKLAESADARRVPKVTVTGDADADRTSLVIEIRDTGIVVAGRAFAEADLDNLFRAAFARDRQTQVVLKAARGVAHRRIVKIMEQAKNAGLHRLAIGVID
jgi:biopolymer transport protein ExbD